MYKYNKETLDFEKINLFSTGIQISLIFLVITILLGLTIVPRAVTTDLTQEEKLIVIREYNEFTEKALVQKIKELNFKFPHIVLAQSYQETGGYKSSIFTECKNLFGMKEAKIRATLSQGTNRGHAYYNSWQESLYDYALFYNTYLNGIKTEGEYFGYLEQYYAEDPNYVLRLKQIIKKQSLKSKFK